MQVDPSSSLLLAGYVLTCWLQTAAEQLRVLSDRRRGPSEDGRGSECSRVAVVSMLMAEFPLFEVPKRSMLRPWWTLQRSAWWAAASTLQRCPSLISCSGCAGLDLPCRRGLRCQAGVAAGQTKSFECCAFFCRTHPRTIRLARCDLGALEKRRPGCQDA